MRGDEGEAAAQWVSELLGEPSRLVRFIGEAARPTALSEARCGSCCQQRRTWDGIAANTVIDTECKPCRHTKQTQCCIACCYQAAARDACLV